MFKNRKHKFFCLCEACKFKRRSSMLYMGGLFSLLIILIWQVLFTFIFVTRLNAFLILVLLACVIIGFFRIIF